MQEPPRVARISLGMLEFGFVPPGRAKRDGLMEIVDVVQRGEAAGYERAWFGEHHTRHAAYTNPCLMAGYVATRTRRIRVGTAGVLLSYAMPLRVVEDLSLLEQLFPGRVEGGLARGVAGAAYNELLGRPCGSDEFEQRLLAIRSLTSDHFPGYANEGRGLPRLWLLGSSVRSAQAAARLGMSFGFAHFYSDDQVMSAAIDAFVDAGGAVADMAIAFAGICAPTRGAAVTAVEELIGTRVVRLKSGIAGPASDWLKVLSLPIAKGVDQFVIQALSISAQQRIETYVRLREAVDAGTAGRS